MGAVLKLLSNKGFIQYNKIVAKNLGVKEAILLGELCSLFEMHKADEIFVLQEKLSEDTALSVKQIRSAIQSLEEKEILIITRRGNPCRCYYSVNEEEIIKLFMENKKTPLLEREPKNKLEIVEKEYLKNYKRLYENGVLMLEKPVINWTNTRRLENTVIEKYGLETIVNAVKKSIDNQFCISTGYSLSTILSAGVLAQLINTRNTRGIANDQLNGTETIDF